MTAATLLRERPNLVWRFIQAVRREGPRKILNLVVAYIRREQGQATVRSRRARRVPDRIVGQQTPDCPGDVFVPLYLDPFGVARPPDAWTEHVLVCVTVVNGAHIPRILHVFGSLPGAFDLHISVTDPAALETVARQCEGVGGLRSVKVRDAAPDASPLHYLLTTLPATCADYDIIGYVDATNEAAERPLVGGLAGAGLLLDSTQGVDQVFAALLGDARVIVPGIDWRRRARSTTSLDATVLTNLADPFTLGRSTLVDTLCDSEAFWLSARAISGRSDRLGQAIARTNGSSGAGRCVMQASWGCPVGEHHPEREGKKLCRIWANDRTTPSGLRDATRLFRHSIAEISQGAGLLSPPISSQFRD